MSSERRWSRFPERIRRPPRLSRIPSFLREAGGIAVHPSMLGRMRSHYLATIGTTGHWVRTTFVATTPSYWELIGNFFGSGPIACYPSHIPPRNPGLLPGIPVKRQWELQWFRYLPNTQVRLVTWRKHGAHFPPFDNINLNREDVGDVSRARASDRFRSDRLDALTHSPPARRAEAPGARSRAA